MLLPDLVAQLGQNVRLHHVGREDVDVTGVRFFDWADVSAIGPGCLVLAIGVGDRDSARAVLSEAEQRHAAAVVFRAGVSDGLPLAEVSVLESAHDVDWGHVHALVRAAIQASGVRVPGVDTGSDLFDLANVVAIAARGAVLVEDEAKNILAYSTVEGQEIDWVRQRGILQRRVPHTDQTDRAYREVALSPGPVRFPPLNDRHGRLAVAIRAGGELLGSMWVVDVDGQAPSDALQLLADSVELASLYILKERTRRTLSASASASDASQLLRGAGEVASNADWARRAGSSVAVVLVPAQEPGADSVHWAGRARSSLSVYLSAFRQQYAITVEDGRLYLILGLGRERTTDLDRVLQGVVEHLRQSLRADVVVAVGTVVPGVEEIPRSRRSADELLSLLQRRPDLPRIATYADLASQVLLHRLAESKEALRLLDDARLHRLLESERPSGQAYVSTLRAYLDALGDTAKAASVCGVHANTVRYRLQKIQELLGLDLADPDDRLVVWLQLRLLAGEDAGRG
ncbi:PucR family transcriptional regulator [Paractinoplanes maris]|uniref:PucR family transcriptional regulator n=1 Tax=Paractinoplanes maris TaxID=1734446 RepID=UPI002021933E|nr:helix-turn-helix domain-containing protein [Actinoplanes maris]